MYQKNIRDNKYNTSCICQLNLFSTYAAKDPSLSYLNMRGFTQVLKASAVVIPNHAYRIRLVIEMLHDSNYDSAVFLSSGFYDQYRSRSKYVTATILIKKTGLTVQNTSTVGKK
jgi:hypothetical protein